MNTASTPSHRVSGSCLCGTVTLTVPLTSYQVAACHCRMCRVWGGSPLFAVEPAGPIELEGEDAITVFASSEWAERAFCRHCGTHLFYRLKDGQHYAIPAGLVDQGQDWHFDHQIFIDQKPAWYHFGNQTQDMTGQEVFDAFGGDG
ncbi:MULTISPECIES: GFA family protein [Halomonas]|uniref:GFA family protein n=1 Tax=Halomonas TaxID=2745 RepID=UPI001C93D7F7|nr:MULTISPECIES: GFA family protein [Halomonas]MBY6208815.1 GFA family protein [Halomonas sp. DP3Y7-2]MBY6227285.1 GFA family protein [Halomonas sp. DP3Y7-1]MCA0914965.1 GFA family protein [Halomonas denitrificans]